MHNKKSDHQIVSYRREKFQATLVFCCWQLMLPSFWQYLLVVFFWLSLFFVIFSLFCLIPFQNCDTLSVADRTGEFQSLRNTPSCLNRGAWIEILLQRAWTSHFFDVLSLCWPDRHPGVPVGDSASPSPTPSPPPAPCPSSAGRWGLLPRMNNQQLCLRWFYCEFNYLKYHLSSIWAAVFKNFSGSSIVAAVVASGFMGTELSPCLSVLSVDWLPILLLSIWQSTEEY